MKKHRLFVPLLALLLLLAACGGEGPEVPITLDDARLAAAPVIDVTEVEGEPAPAGTRFDPAAVRRLDPAAVDGEVAVRGGLADQKEGIPYGEGQLVYVKSGGSTRIVLRDMASDASTVLYEGASEVESVATTVDGGVVAFSAMLEGDLEVFLYDIVGDLLGAPRTLARLTDDADADTHVTMSLGDTEEPLKIAWATPRTVGEGDAAQELASYAVGTLEAAGSVDAAELAVFRPDHDAGALLGDPYLGLYLAYASPSLSGDGSTVVFVASAGAGGPWEEGLEVPAIAPSGPEPDYTTEWFDTIAGDYGRVSLSYDAGYALAAVVEGGATVVRLIDIGTFVNTDGDEILVTDLRTLDGDADPFLTAGAESFTYASGGFVYVALASSASRDQPISGLEDPSTDTAPYWARSPVNSAAVTYEGAVTEGAFTRPGGPPEPVGYHAYEYTPELTAWFEIDSQQAYDGYLLLYEGSFDPDSPETNLIAANDDFGGFFDPERDPPGRSRIVHELQAGTTYVIVTTAYGAEADPAAATFVNTITPGVPQPEPEPEPTELPLPDNTGFNITLRFWDDSFDGSQAALFYEAADRWAEVIVDDVPNIAAFELSAAETTEGAPGLVGELDDVVIDAAMVDIDGPGGVLARAGAFYARNDPFLPTYGIMEFDAAEFEEGGFYSDPAALRAVILHEMGHVLGISRSFWIPNGLLVGNPDDTSFCSDVAGDFNDPRFTGPGAVAAWNGYGGEGNVPVANTGGCGTADSHWREIYLDDELMTGYAAGGTEPLSEVTIGGLEDIGYGVDYGVADAWTLPELPRLAQVAPATAEYEVETDFGPAFTGSLAGAVTAPVTPVDLYLDTSADPEDPASRHPANSTSGCEASDFAGFPAGDIALLQRGACAFGVKAQNALDAGASAVLIANQGTADRTGIYSGTFGADIAIVGLPISFTLGAELAGIDGLQMLVDTDTSGALRTARLHAPIDWRIAEEEVELRGVHMPDGELRMLDRDE